MHKKFHVKITHWPLESGTSHLFERKQTESNQINAGLIPLVYSYGERTVGHKTLKSGCANFGL